MIALLLLLVVMPVPLCHFSLLTVFSTSNSERPVPIK